MFTTIGGMTTNEVLASDMAIMTQIATTVFGGLIGYDVMVAAVVGFVAYWPILFGALWIMRRT